jgi:hypothetical protein
MSTEYQNLVKECAEQGKALARMMAADGTIEPLYLYHRPSKPGKPGKLLLIRDSKTPTDPGAFDLVLTTGEGLRGNVPYEGYFQWVYDRAKRAPILAIE